MHVIDTGRFESVKTALHMIKAYLGAIEQGGMNISTGIDRLFGVQGFF